jgi:hypothetical protein
VHQESRGHSALPFAGERKEVSFRLVRVQQEY